MTSNHGPIKQDQSQVMQEGSLLMESVFAREESSNNARVGGVPPFVGKAQATGGRRSNMSYNKDLRGDGLGRNSSIMRQASISNQPDQMLEQTEKQMKEVMAREILMENDDGDAS